MRKPIVLSLFCGPGGLDLGFRQAGFQIALAVDISADAIATHRRNFPGSASITADLIELGPEGIVHEFRKHVAPGSSIAVIGGPPCQGFSRANTSSVSSDPRNALPQLYLEIIARLQREYSVEFVLFENVLGIRDKKHSAVFAGILSRLKTLGFSEKVNEYCALDYGVPQIRRRVIISAFKSAEHSALFNPTKSFAGPRTVRETIEQLPEPTYFRSGLRGESIPHHPNHWTMNPRSKRFVTDGVVRAGTRSFRQLDWDRPSPTVAYGNREIHVHPRGHRRLSVFEAMLLQGFPATFVLEGNLSAQVQQVSNAVPPPLALSLASAAAQAMTSKTSHSMLA